MRASIPSNETLWETITTPSGKYFITSNIARSRYYLYKKKDTHIERIAYAASPTLLLSKVQ